MNQKKKVFISFLGVNTYRESKYYFKKDRSDIFGETPYVQEAIIRQWPFAENALNQEGAEVLIFTTKAAYEKTYTQRITSFANKERNTPDKFEEDGLEFKLQKLVEEGLIQNFAHREIQDGFSEDEIWSIFDVIVNNIDEGTELYFDVTYGYRFLPLLTLSLINYLAAVKNCELKALFYGNFESGQAENEAKGLGRTALVTAPIHILTNIVELNQWTDAVEMFTKASYPDELANLIKKENPKLASDVQKVADAILNCRGHQLTQEVDIDRIKNDINNLDGDEQISHQLRPILKKIDDKLSTLGNSTTLKGFHAVEWCIEHNMVQQGYTFLLETTISWLIEETEGARYINREDYREIANGVLNKISANRLQLRASRRNSNLSEDKVKEIARSMERTIAPNRLHLTSNYKKMTGTGKRNDINHCGYKNNYATVGALKRDLKNISDAIISIVS
ncbi:CRISPR-associated protein, TM1812 family [Saprospira grandis DSM 2844]|uniref:CRISPR-associated protein, TM1812 family n=1 Tax=Saprospira grandis DSM 2844 TaxID=694433 RepID=J1I6P9_9BACT|nr:TIGR02221 family CRISPR-associated protein [Saprospira grandis]EJF54480.1 CRISPR-associated protein, TM1812 family [Saprospira grandis DSM 2844]